MTNTLHSHGVGSIERQPPEEGEQPELTHEALGPAEPLAEGASDYFLGALVLRGHEDGGIEIFDGLQRTTTLTIL
ncbi:MAG: DUF262 domain-containing protein, partial [Pseudomonadota bacterium]